MKKLIAILLGTFLFVTMQTAFAEIMIFVGDGCPHCAIVEQYLTENNVAEKLPIKIYEVWYNADNQALYTQKAQEVGYDGGGVPLLINGKEYTVGDSPIIDYLNNLQVGSSRIQASVVDAQQEEVKTGEFKDFDKPLSALPDKKEIPPYLYVAMGAGAVVLIFGVVYFVRRKK